MANFSALDILSPAVTDSAIASTASETAFGGGFSLPANTLAIGHVIKGEWGGVYSTTLTPTLNFRVRYGAAGTGVLILDFGTISGGAGVTNRSWKIVFTAVVRTIGSTGTISADAVLVMNNGASELVVGTVDAKSTNSTVTIDTTATTTLNLTAQWSASSASNTVTRVTEVFAKAS